MVTHEIPLCPAKQWSQFSYIVMAWADKYWERWSGLACRSWKRRRQVGCIPVKLPWIFRGAPLKFNGAPGNIQGNLTGMINPRRSSYRLIFMIVIPKLVKQCLLILNRAGHRWIPLIKASDTKLAKLWCFLWSVQQFNKNNQEHIKNIT